MTEPKQKTDSFGPIIGGVGQSVIHDSARKHVAGAAIYIDDMAEPPGTQHLFLVKSPKAHARILSIDVSAALAAPGVNAVLTAADIPGHNDISPIGKGEPALAEGVVEYIGHPVAVVAADSMAQARDAADLVRVEYEELPAILSIEEALAAESFLLNPMTMVRGDWQDALEQAPHRIKARLDVGGQDHFYLESHIAFAFPGEDRDMLVHSSTQHPTEVQHGVCHVLGVPSNAVTVECRRMGGGFGGKESQPTIIAAIAALVARKTGKPAKLRLNRDDDMIVTGKRHNFLVEYDIGFDGEGRLLAGDFLYAAQGGNVADLTGPVVTRALCHTDNSYYFPAIRARGFACKTHTVSNTAFRGFGGPQGIIGIEAAMDHIARHLGIAPEEVRRRNYYGIGARDHTPYGQRVEDNILEPLTEQLLLRAEFEERKAEIARFNARNTVLKKGIAMMPLKFGISFNLPSLNQAGALVHVYTDGSIHLNHGGTEMGQGLFLKVAQVVAQTLQVDLDRVKISATRTDKVPNTSATAASTGSDLNGMAAQDAALQIKNRLTLFLAEKHKTDPGKVVFADNKVTVAGTVYDFAEVAKLAWAARISLSAAGFYRTPKIHWDLETMQGRPFFYYAYGAAVCEVVIDTLTGENRCLRTDIIHDVGASLNPAIDKGQIEGAFVQGMGWVTMEELWWDKTGRLRTHAPSTYKIPGSRDVPPDFRVHLLEDAPNRENTIYRSKAVGEPPLMLATGVWLALRDAVANSVDVPLPVNLDAPATPERILWAVEDQRRRAAEAA